MIKITHSKASFLMILFACAYLLGACCHSKAKAGVVVTVLEIGSNKPLPDVTVICYDVDANAQVSSGSTDANGKVHLKTSAHCKHALQLGVNAPVGYSYPPADAAFRFSTQDNIKTHTILLNH